MKEKMKSGANCIPNLPGLQKKKDLKKWPQLLK